MSTELFVMLVFVVLGLLVTRLGMMMRASPTDPALTVRNRFTESDPRVCADASRYLGGAMIRLGLGAAALALALALALHGLALPRSGQLPEPFVLAVDGLVVLVGVCVLLVLHWLHARERWHHYRAEERAEERWPAEE